MDKINTILILSCIWLLTLSASEPVIAEQQQVLSRNYVGLAVEVHAPLQCYPGETITISTKIQALEDLANTSATLFIWSSKSEGHTPWGVSFTILDIEDLSKGMTDEKDLDVEIPSDLSPGLTYGILSLDWSTYFSSQGDQSDKASFRATYVKNRSYEDLKTLNQSNLEELQTTRTFVYIFIATSILSPILAFTLAKRKSRNART